jgi:hypothetical protein
VNTTQPTFPSARRRSTCLFVTVVACAAGAATLTACAISDANAGAIAPEAPTVIERSYCIASGELVELTVLSNGAVRYSPTGAIVGTALSTGIRAAC